MEVLSRVRFRDPYGDAKLKVDVSNKQGGNFTKPHFKKGYYPAKVISIEARKDKEGNLFVGQYGNQMIIKFQIWDADKDGDPTVPMTATSRIVNGPEVEQPVELPKFVYYTYKDKTTGELSTAVTPNSAITKTFTALGWEFDAEKGLDTSQFIGVWAEVNVDDYEYDDDGKKAKASTIKDISVFEGTEPKGSTPPKSSAPADDLPDSVSSEMDIDVIDLTEDSDIPVEIANKLAVLREQVDAGLITKEGFEMIKAEMLKTVKK